MHSVEGFRLSPQQKRLWQLQADGSAAYRAQGMVVIEGPLQPATLAEAIRQVADRHEILRTTFHLLPSTALPVQVIAEHAAPVYHTYDLTDHSPAEQESRLAALLDQLGAEHSDLQNGPVLCSALATLAPTKHALLLSLPALCADTTTIGNLIQAIGAAYAAEQCGQSLEDDPTQYADVAELFNELLESDETESGRAYWRRQDLSALPLLTLPFEKRASQGAFAPQRHRLTIAPEITARIAACAERYNTTVESGLLACWQVLLARLTGQSTIVVGTAQEGRAYEGLDTALGVFSRYAPVAARLAEDTSFAATVRQIDRSTQEVAELQEYFSWDLIGGKTVEQPCFPFGFDVTRHPAAFGVADLTCSIVEQRACIDRFKLRLSCALRDQILDVALHYDPAIYAAAEIERLAERFHTLLDAATTTPEAPITVAQMVGPEERRLLCDTLNATRAEYQQDRCIHQLFEAQAARTPDAVAVVYEDHQISYAALNARANQLARHLRGLGVGPETPVGLCVERSIEMIVGVLGILKAGGCYVPLDPAYPQERLSFMLQDSQASVLLTQQRLQAEVLAALPLPAVVRIDAEWPQIAGNRSDNLSSATSPDNMAYVIYTSGSTGTPKGVVVRHRSLANLAVGLQQTIYADSPGAPLRVSMNGPLVFDTSVKQWLQLLSGHTLAIIPDALRLDLDALADYLGAQQIDVLDCTPSLLKPLLRSSRLGRYPGRVLVGGEAIDEALWQTLATDEQRRFYNLYGPTEDTVDATISRIDRAAPPPTIGRPIANTQVYLLDSRQRLVPLGLPGELCLGGDGLARGYLGRPDLTAEKFAPDPFSEQPGARLYRTGDLARYRPDGSLEYLGRIDGQVKLRGFRVELGEIEAILSQHPAVQDAAAIVRADLPDQQRLVAYVVPGRQAAFTVRQVLRMERERQIDQGSCYELPNGLVVAHVNKHETEFLYNEIFQQQSYLRHGITLHDGACVFDVGANIGLFSLFVGERCPGATVYACEPIPAVFEVLRTNAQLYDFKIIPIQAGVADTPGEAVFTSYAHASTMSGRYVDADEERQVIRSLVLTQEHEAHGAAPLDETLLDEMIADRLTSERSTCPMTTVSEMIRRYNVERIDLLKIDAQKSELDVLDGIEPQDWPKIRQIVLEVHDIAGRVGHVQSLLERQGYQVAVEQETALADTPLYNLYARRAAEQPAASDAPRRETWTSQKQLTADLRRFLSERLPDYMVPSAFVLLESLPLTTNGKLDRRGLPAPDQTGPSTEQSYVAPRTATEAVLSRIWAEILRLERIGIHNNFFELGGDSILGIQVVARANQAGLRLTPRQLFQHQTIAELAAVADAGTPAQPTDADHEPVLGPLPLLPIQRWFFEHEWPDVGVWNQVIRLALRQPIAPALLEQVVGHLVQHHEALRLRFVHTDQGWQQEIAAPPAQIPFTSIDLSALPEPEQDRTVEQAAADLAARMELGSGVLLHVALLDRGAQRPNLLLLATHALAVDGFSRRILAEDLQAACQQLSSGAAIEPPRKTTSLKRWAETLADYAHSDTLRQELAYWLGLASADSPRLPLDVSGATSAGDDPLTVVVSLDTETTRALLHDVPAAYRTEINDALLTALVEAFAQWTGQRSLLLDVRGHGREALFDGIDLSRTVGWLTSIFPVRLDLREAHGSAPALLAVKEQLRQIPQHGMGYGVLRYLSDQSIADRLRALPAPEVSFNYLGQFDQVLPESAFALTPDQADPSGGLWSPRYLIEIQGGVVGGELRLAWKYSPHLHRRATIERLAQSFSAALHEVIAHCQAPDAGGYTPSDFPMVNLNQQALDAILAQLRKAQG
ncbi:MAG TPA: amino acid adenylation domain-containing protein [Herpetosiphonaceae bacterium]